MASTTNYGWTTPDDTSLVKDGAAAIRSLGTSIDTSVKALSPGTTAGDIDYYTTSTAKARLGIGTAGQLLAVNAGATAPEWVAAPSSGGMTLLSTTTLSGASTTISSISQAYVDLHIYIYGATSTSNASVYCRPNGSSGITDHSYFYRNSGNQSDINADLYFIGATAPAGNTTNASSIQIFNYASTTARKPFIAMGTFIENSTSARSPQTGGGAINTTTAISSLLFAPGVGTFSSGTVLIYGVK
jgi:hypothetical protein